MLPIIKLVYTYKNTFLTIYNMDTTLEEMYTTVKFSVFIM